MMGWMRWLFMNQTPVKRRKKNIRQLPLDAAIPGAFTNGFSEGFQ